MGRIFLFLPLGLQLFAQIANATLNGTNITEPVGRGNGSALYPPLFERHSNSTPIFINSTGETANPLIKALQDKNNKIKKRSFYSPVLAKRDDWVLPEGTCAPGTPCVNGACCSKTGICGYTPKECGADVCISNCKATAPCGQYAKPEDQQCPLNVCCSFFGYCGSTDQFCTTSGERPCQNGYGSCGDAPRPSCAGGDSTSGRVVGYYEGWATTRACDKRQPEDIDLTAFTHLNFAFAFFHPTSFQMAPMSAGDEDLYRRFTALKSKKPALKTWIAVGGWSFNDATNIPNTRTAFSDMVSTKANRQAFIASLSNFLRTYNFDGVDIDWEYPSADDRGGVKADKANFVTFLQELRSAFGSRYGISLTLPASFWYLKGFDIKAIQNYVDWMNMMSYDIHGNGVWDSGNKHTGPYVRPHTNLTEIDEGLDLLWRAGVEPSKVVLGLGWYGRSFTLSNPGCNVPNGACTFSEGGKPGECTNSAGTLTNAEINRIIAKGGVTKGFDQQAAVRWITWDSNQWVSYDDGETIQMKVNHANKRCLGGKMIWAVDQDDSLSSSTNDLLGIGPANGISAEKAQKAKDDLNNATQAAAIASSCYWTFCGETCKSGYFGATEATGQISGIQRNTECPRDQPQTLCCAPGTTMGRCNWDGWRGLGLSCSPACEDSSATIVARNTNYKEYDCNGGYMAYCCSGFIPSSKTNTGNLALIGQGELMKRDGKGAAAGALGAAACVGVAVAVNTVAAFLTFGLSLVFGIPETAVVCASVGTVIGFAAGRTGGSRQGRNKPFKPTLPLRPKKPGKPPRKTYGQWDIVTYPSAPQSTSSQCDCFVTYTCRYGKGYDEICDNQRYGIDKALHGNTVYHYGPRAADRSYSKHSWANGQRHSDFKSLAQTTENHINIARCHVDEFPMGALNEARLPNMQVVRLVNGPANMAQGRDFKDWRSAVWIPCSAYKRFVCGTPSARAAPPITWAFNFFDQGRLGARTDGSHFLQAYGFDSQTAASECWATYVTNKVWKTIYDHGFRVLTNDPMFTASSWPKQTYSGKAKAPYPTSVASGDFLKREAVKSVLLGEAQHVEFDHEGQPEYCVLVNDYEGGMICIPDHDLFNHDHDLHEHAHKRHHQHHHYHNAHTVTSSTATATLAPDVAKAAHRVMGPVQTPADVE